jgi:histidine decarboxylase
LASGVVQTPADLGTGVTFEPTWSPLSNEARSRLDALLERMQSASQTLVGYPCNQAFDYSELLPLLAYSLNNVGDPFATSNYRLSTHDIERDVVHAFAELTGATTDDVWGYVTNGGTEGNMYGLYLAREMYPGGLVYYSEDTHYSVQKSLRVLGMRSIQIRSHESGAIDERDLYETLRIHRDVPPILFLNAGTTMKGAIDGVAAVRRMLEELRLGDHYLHVDAALSGMILPFVEGAPEWNFSAGVDSLSISGHKFLGSPIPCGVVLAKRKNVERIARSIEYVGVLDTTLTGSRNALSPVVLWYALQRFGKAGLRQVVRRCLDVAKYAERRMEEAGIPASLGQHSVTVVFPRPSDEVVARWQIAPLRDIGHIVVMPHVTRAMVDAFIADYLAHPPSSGRPSHHGARSIPPAPERFSTKVSER